MIRARMPEQISRGGRSVAGFGQVEAAPPAAAVVGTSPWAIALTTSVLGAATGWVIEEVARSVRRKRRR